MLNQLLRQVVLLRDQFQCKLCGDPRCAKRDRAVLQACHILPKGTYRSLEYDLDNVVAGTWGCHLGARGWHLDPLFQQAWNERNPGRLEMLRLRAQMRKAAGWRLDIEATRIYLEQELRKYQ